MIPEIEKVSQTEIKPFQEQKLRELAAYVYAKSPYYKRLFVKHNLTPESIQTLEDLQRFPVTTKDDLQTYNDDFLCVPKQQIIDYVTTSGTLGEPVVIGLTDADLDRLAYNEAISFACSGVTKDDIIQLMTTMDRRFMAGMAYFLGARKLGAGIIRVGSGVPELQWDSILKFQPTYLITVPSFLLKLITYAEAHNIDVNKTSVKAAICIGEPIRNQDFTLNVLSEKIKSKWNIELFSTYASTEMSTAFNECEAHLGGHHHPELIITEILNKENKPVLEGEVGELTITTLGVEGIPLVRFKTGDMLKAHSEPCSCGRNTLRLGPVVGRKKQMIKYKGTTLYPPAMLNVLQHFEAVEAFVIEILTNDLGTDEILLKIAARDPSEQLVQDIKDHFRAKLRVTPQLVFEKAEVIEALRRSKTDRKPQVIIDRRT
ncbi:phenylacetate--CoA ligase family protein [Marixanthomonas ophiurae]|uniref:Phenylacetate--CoA ligase family protein n=1 Tax=Marixanthomonas ophiurae TaxID=387659 RepID=A0A3E1QBS1_9FLAO|nr:AMP-binding protein [Marixanthomonas ophiurae]RFN59585.1 phenylacetate--CoA ligase family protein [Marixanthomonas ophiurae]